MNFSMYCDEIRVMIADFLQFLNQFTYEYVASSGTGANLWLGDKCKRYTEDVTLDFMGGSTARTGILHIIKSYCGARDYKMQCVSGRLDSTSITFEVFDVKSSVKMYINVCYRLSMCDRSTLCTKVNGVTTYNLDALVNSLCLVCTGDIVENLYDIVMLCKYHWDKLAPSSRFCVISKFVHIDLSMIMKWLEKYNKEGLDVQMLRCDVRALYEELGL